MHRLLLVVNGKRFQGCMTLFWIVMIPVAHLSGLVHNVSFVSDLSLWALVASHGAWWAASGVAEEPVADEVVEKFAEKTDLID